MDWDLEEMRKLLEEFGDKAWKPKTPEWTTYRPEWTYRLEEPNLLGLTGIEIVEDAKKRLNAVFGAPKQPQFKCEKIRFSHSSVELY